MSWDYGDIHSTNRFRDMNRFIIFKVEIVDLKLSKYFRYEYLVEDKILYILEFFYFLDN
jgi:hypothetical protein